MDAHFDIAFELIPGDGAPLLEEFPPLGALVASDLSAAANLTDLVLGWVCEQACDIAAVGIEDAYSGLGAYESAPATPCWVVEINGSLQSVQEFAAVVGWVTQQTEVILAKLDRAGTVRGLDLTFTGQASVESLWADLIRLAPFLSGYMPIPVGPSQVGMRLIDESSTWMDHNLDAIGTALDVISDMYGVEIEVDELRMTFVAIGNDWRAHPDGQGYLERFAPGRQPEVARRLAGLAKEYASRIREGLQRNSPGGRR